jgi:lipoyl(octanoyl) transferase
MTLAPALGLAVRDLGVIAYPEAMALQDDLVEQRLHGTIPDTLLLLEHPPVITLGRRGSLADVFLSEGELFDRGIAVAKTTRGGLVTYHGPGQLVGYPIVHLRERKLSIPCYVRALELAIISALGDLRIEAHLNDDHIGVWTTRGKIAAIGVAQRHGVTHHGFAINLQPNLDHFALINPCGIAHLGVTSAEALLGHAVDVEAFKSRIAEAVGSKLTEKALSLTCSTSSAASPN